MRSGKAVIGMRVFALDCGAEMDRIKDLVIDRSAKRVVALLVDKGGWFHKARVLPLRDVHSFGKDAIMVASGAKVVEAEQMPEIQSLDRHSQLQGTVLMTSDGREIGTINDVEFNEQSGEIVAFEVSKGILADSISGRAMLPAYEEVLVGEDVVIVNAEMAKPALHATGASSNGGNGHQGTTQHGTVQRALDTAGKYVRSGTHYVEHSAGEFWAAAQDVPAHLTGVALQAIEEFRVSRALGAHATRDVRAPDSKIIVHSGDVITPETLAQARDAGVLDDVLRASSHDMVDSNGGTMSTTSATTQQR